MTWDELQKQDRADLGAIFSTREGARFLSRLFGLTRVFEISYVAGDAGATAFNEGVRNVGLRVYADVLEADENPEARLRAAGRERQITEER